MSGEPLSVRPVVRALLLLDVVDSTKLVSALGDRGAAELFARVDRVSRDAFARHGGREIDRTDGFLVLFERPVDAVAAALDVHQALRGVSASAGRTVAARAAVHVGEVVLRDNPPEDVARGAKPLEVEGLAKPLAARVMALAQGGQTLVTQTAADLVRRAAESGDLPDVAFAVHGAYPLKGIAEPVGVAEVARVGTAFRAPARPGSPWRRRAAVGLVAVALVGVAVAAAIERPPPAPPNRRVSTEHGRRVLASDASLFGWTVSADGSRLAWIVLGQGVYVADAQGKDPRLVPGTADLDARTVSFAPDGRLVMSLHIDPEAAMVRVDPETGASEPLPWRGVNPTFSADGKRVLYGRPDGLWVADVASGTPRKIADGDDFHASWSPDGAWVAALHQSDHGGSLDVIAADGSRRFQIADGGFGEGETRGSLWPHAAVPTWVGPDRIDYALTKEVDGDRVAELAEATVDLAAGAVVEPRRTRAEWPGALVYGFRETSDGTVFVGVSTVSDDIFSVPIGEDGLAGGPVVHVTTDRRDDAPTGWTSDDAVLFFSDRAGRDQVYAQRPGDPVATRLSTEEEGYQGPAVGAGHAVLYVSIIPLTGPTDRAYPTTDILRVEGGGAPKTIASLDVEPPRQVALGCDAAGDVCTIGYAGAGGAEVDRLDPVTGQVGPRLDRGGYGINSPNSPSPDGRRVFWVGEAGTYVADLGGEAVTALKMPFRWSTGVTWRGDSAGFFVTADDALWSVDLDLHTTKIADARGAHRPKASADGRWVAWAQADGGIDVWRYDPK